MRGGAGLPRPSRPAARLTYEQLRDGPFVSPDPLCTLCPPAQCPEDADTPPPRTVTKPALTGALDLQLPFAVGPLGDQERGREGKDRSPVKSLTPSLLGPPGWL